MPRLEQLEGLSVSDTDQNTESLPDKTPKPVPQKNSNTKSAQQPADAAVKKPTAQPGKPSSRQPASKGVTGFALLLSLCALGLAGYVGWRGQTLVQALPELRTGLDQLQPQIARQQARLATLEQNSSASLDQYQQHLQQCYHSFRLH